MLQQFLNGGYSYCMNALMNGHNYEFDLHELINDINDISIMCSFPKIKLDNFDFIVERTRELNLYNPKTIIQNDNTLNLDVIGSNAIRFAVNRRPMMYYTSNGYLIDITPIGIIVYDDFAVNRYINVAGSQIQKDIHILMSVPAGVQQYDIPFKVLLSLLCSHSKYGHIFKFISNDVIINKMYANSDVLQVLFQHHAQPMEKQSIDSSKYLNLLFIINALNILDELCSSGSLTFTNFRKNCFKSFLSYGGSNDTKSSESI